MAKTQTFQTDAGEITLKRPSFDQMRSLGEKVKELFEADSAQELLFSDAFDELMKAAADTDDDYTRLVGECDLTDVWELWEGYVEFARFQSFFEGAEASHQARQAAMQKVRLDRQREQIEMLKKQGLVPADFSIGNVMTENMSAIVKQALSESGPATPTKRAAKKK